jgi:hypothetical protein
MTTQTPSVLAGKWYKASDGRVNLPQVRESLASLDSVEGLSASDKENLKDKLQGSLKASASDDITLRSTHSIEASESGTLPTKVMLLRAGTFNTEKYGAVPLQASDLTQMKENFDNGLGMADNGQTGIPIDYAHQSHLNAAGWIKNLSIEGDALFGGDIEWSGSGRKALLDKEYKCLSSDFYPAAFGEWVDAESGVRASNVIVGAALTNRPMFTGNQPVIASEIDTNKEGKTTTIINIEATENKETSMNIDVLRVKAAADLTGPEQRFLQANADKLSDDEKKKYEIVASETPKPTNTEVKSVQATELKAANEQIAGLQASVEALQANVTASNKEKAENTVDEAIGTGKIVANQKDKWVGLILADEGNKELLSNLPDNKLLGSTQGSNASGDAIESAREKQARLATELMASDDEWNKRGIQAAMAQVAKTEKGLAEAVASENKALAGVRGAAA